MLTLLRQIDKATGYIFMPSASNVAASQDELAELTSNAYALFSSGAGAMPGGWDARDVQERWGERKELYDELEREQWKAEWEKRQASMQGEAGSQGQ
jgi:hypothetical protein